MRRSPTPTRRRRLASATAVTGLFALLPAVAPAPAGAAPAEDCAEPFPLAEVVPDQSVTGLTVDRGTEPEPFTGTVLGTIQDGISPGIDMVVADLDSEAIAAAGGIWQGMSGSPVYAEDGRLIGAVSYGLAQGPSPIAGITPFEAMDDYLAADPAARVALPRRLTAAVTRRTDVSSRAAGRGLTQLQEPLGVSGVSPQVLARAARAADGRRWFSGGVSVMGRAAAAAGGPTADDVVAGGNLGASLSYGEIAIAGVGTATSVCEGRVVGLGHPFRFAGSDRTYGLHPAAAVYVQPEPLGQPFKVTNLGDPVGAVTDDHLTGVTGAFGDTPDVTTVRSDVTSGDRRRVGTSYVTTQAALGEVTFYQHLGNRATVVDDEAPGSEKQTWTIQGVDSDGGPFTIRYTDRFAARSSEELIYESALALPDLLEAITSLDGVRVTSVLNEVVVSKDARVLRVGPVRQRRNGRMVRVTEERPALARAGKPLRLRVTVLGGARPRSIGFTFSVPKGARGAMGEFLAVSNDWFEEEEEFFTEELDVMARRRAATRTPLDELVAELRARPRSDQLISLLYLEGRRGPVVRQKLGPPLHLPVTGGTGAMVVVR